jgi:hypothetical protein
MLPTTYKILPNILVSRLTPCIDEITGDNQCGFQHTRTTNDQILSYNGEKMGV